MKKLRFTVSQVIKAIKENGPGLPPRKRWSPTLCDRYTVSIALLCRTVCLARSLHYRKSARDDVATEAKLTELACEYTTRGFDRYYLKIKQKGLKWNRKRVLRVYRKLNLGLRRKHKKRINRPYEEHLVQPILTNVTWSMDFMSDALEEGRKVRVLNIIDGYNREAMAVETELSFPAARVARVLERLCNECGTPGRIRVDNGPKYNSHELADYCERKGIELLFIPPGKPNRNGYIERFNRTFREDVLYAYIFEGLEQLATVSEQRRTKYSHGHPHQSPAGVSLITFKQARHKVMGCLKKKIKFKPVSI